MTGDSQKSHVHHVSSEEKFPLSLIASDMISPLNVGSLFRLCDALGIKKLYLCGDTALPPNSKIRKTSRSTEEHVDYEKYEDAAALVTSLKESGSLIIALEITHNSVEIGSDEFISTFTKNTSVSLILGSENTGIEESLLSLADVTVHIPMQGNNSSMNVVTAAAIACYQITHVMGLQQS